MSKSIAYIYSQLAINGGTDRILTDKANYLANHGYEITIITESQMGKPIVFPLSSKVRLIDIGLDYDKQYNHNIIYRCILFITYSYFYKKRLSRILKEIRPDIVVTLMGRSLDFVTQINDGSIKLGEAHTTKKHLRSLHLMEQKNMFYKFLARFIKRRQITNVQKLSALVLLTPDDAKDWGDDIKTYIIPNFLKSIPQETSNIKNKNVIMVGRYNDAKGYEYLVEAWKFVHHKHPDWHLNIYGSGELHDNVEKWIIDANLQDTMIMHEPTNDIMQKYLESSICVISSVYEGFSMAILEAMASGVPCISFDCPYGPHNIIKDGEDGILVEPLNSKALGNSICYMIEHEDLRIRLGRQAHVNIQRFSQEIVMEKWIELFNSF